MRMRRHAARLQRRPAELREQREMYRAQIASLEHELEEARERLEELSGPP